MELVERYLQAVKFWLPADQQDDILAELRDDLAAQIEERTEALGRELSDSEVRSLLAEQGRPLVAAGRYFPQRQLIGPLLYPAYVFVLKITALCFMAPWLAVQLAGIVLAAPSPIFASWLAVMEDAVGVGFAAWAVVTAVFVVGERALTRSDLLTHWDPSKLPPAKEPRLIPRAASAFELIVELGIGVLVPLSLLFAATATGVLHIGALEIGLSPIWSTVLWGTALLSLARAALAAANLARPWWTRTRALAQAVCNLGVALLSWWVMQSHLLAHIASPAIPPERAADIAAAVNLWLERLAPLALVVWGFVLAIDIYRIWRTSTARPTAADQGRWSASRAS